MLEPDNWKCVRAVEYRIVYDCPWILFPFSSLLEGLVQGSAILWPYLPLGTNSLLVMGPVSSVWGGGSVWVLGRGFYFIWDRVFSVEGLGSLSWGLVLGSAILFL